jgi:hypothetical protein
MRTLLLALMLVCATPAYSATLFWDYGGAPVTGTVAIMRATTPAGPWVLVATVPTSPMAYSLTPGNWGVYRVDDSKGKPLTNLVTYSADVKSTPLVEATSNLAVKQLTPDQVEVQGVNCPSGVKATGEGQRYVVVCIH